MKGLAKILVLVVVMTVVVGAAWYGLQQFQRTQAIIVWFAEHKGIEEGGMVKSQGRQVGKIIEVKPLRGGVLLFFCCFPEKNVDILLTNLPFT